MNQLISIPLDVAHTKDDFSDSLYDLTIPFHGSNREGVATHEGLREHLRRIGLPGGIKGQCKSIHEFPEVDYTEDLHRIDRPTLIIHGDED